MPDLTRAQVVASEPWGFYKRQAHYWRSWKYTPGAHSSQVWLSEMRNAWVSYHAGADWMREGWRASEVARLTAERDEARIFVEALQLETALEWGIDGTQPAWRTEEEWMREFDKRRGFDDEGNLVASDG